MARDIEILKEGLKNSYIDYILKDVPDSSDGINYVPIKETIKENLIRLTNNMSIAIDNYIGDDSDYLEFLNDLLGDNSGSSGVMFKSVYDKNENGRVDVAESLIIDIVAKEEIPIYSCITSDGRVADSDVVSDANKIIGVSIEPISINTSGKIMIYGIITDSSWTWQVGDLFLNKKILSQVSPDTIGFSKLIGKAKSENIIIINLEESIIL